MHAIAPQILEKFGDDIISDSAYPELLYHCPYCEERKGTPDTKGNLYVNNKNLKYFCQRCQARGRVTDSVKGYHFEVNPSDTEFAELIESIVRPKDEVIDYEYEVPNLRPIPGTEAWNYLVGRGITQEMMDFYDIRVGSVVSKYKYRIIIPNRVIVDENGKSWTDMFVARYIRQIPKGPDGKDLIPRYLNPFGDNRRKVVFNLHRIPKGVPIMITEGCITSLSAGSNAVATYGKYVTDVQLTQILSNEPSALYVCLDPDAYDTAIELCERIKRKSNVPLYLVVLPDGCDANDLGHAKFMEYVINSRPYDKNELAILNILKSEQTNSQ